jgi:16S rRNA (adenine1518-N6/adenine1519-N6)-dimethyltransferase
VRKVAECVAPHPSDVFLEIGPGRGALTAALASRARTIITIEIDRDLAAALRPRLAPNVELIEGDVLRENLGHLVDRLAAAAAPDGRVRVVGNLPYNISSPILFRLVTLARHDLRVFDATVMLQREVADRVVATPRTGDWGPLSVAIQLRADVTRELALPPGAFRPMPRVHSVVVRLCFRARRVAMADEALFDSVVRAIFGQRRKMLRNALQAFASTRGRETADVLDAAGIDGQRRPETLDLEELARLADTFA